MAMALHPAVQKRIQDEIDRVVGTDRLPTFEDRPSLPLVDAVVRETLRWRPVVPLGVPHSANKDDVYKGYFIPKGRHIS
jgi:cytochrome P450